MLKNTLSHAGCLEYKDMNLATFISRPATWLEPIAYLECAGGWILSADEMRAVADLLDLQTKKLQKMIEGE